MAISDRGFASMSADKQREIASKGGKASRGSRGGKNRASSASKTEAPKSDAQNNSTTQ